MLPFHAPPGTRARDYLTNVVPEAHRALVPNDAGARPFTVHVTLMGERTVGYAISGSEITVDPRARGDANLVVVFEPSTVDRFLADFAGPRRFVPRFEPRGAALVTDPRVLTRVTQVKGSLSAIIPDFEGGSVRLWIAAFGEGRGQFDPRDDEADVTVSVPLRTFESLLGGALTPEQALAAAESGVAVRGKRLVAMQLALALAPFFPPPGGAT